MSKSMVWCLFAYPIYTLYNIHIQRHIIFVQPIWESVMSFRFLICSLLYAILYMEFAIFAFTVSALTGMQKPSAINRHFE